MIRFRKPKIGLALGSGGAKGLAHIGVIKVLEKNNIPIDFISGSSIGALVGGMYATFKDIDKIEKIALSTSWRQALSLLDPAMSLGLLSGRRMKTFFEKCIGDVEFSDLKIPFTAVATDIENGKTIYFNKGQVALAIRASVSVPLVFRPVEHQGKLLADGGLTLPIPVDILKSMGADFSIAVNIEANYFRDCGKQKNAKISFFKIANNSLNILRHQLAAYSCEKADVIIQPELGKNIYWDKFLKAKKIIKIGEDAATESLPEIKKLIK